MANEKLSRPNVKALLSAANDADARLYAIGRQEEVLRTHAMEAAQALYEERVRRTLEQMDIEQIGKSRQGIRVSLLRDAGVTNIWQADQMSEQAICAIDGLGEQSAQKICSTVDQIVDNTRRTIRIRIEAENPGQADSNLIHSLFKIIYGKPLIQQAQQLYRLHHQSLQAELALAKQATNPVSWIFKSNDKKQQITDAVASISSRLNGPFGDGSVTGQYSKLLAAQPAVYWQDFRQNAARYYAELERLGLEWIKKDTAGSLPAQLAKEIEAQPLDLKYMNATLRSYQEFGTKYIVHQKRSLLGDEMGLGKTIQAIAAMAALKAEGATHFMVVCPASVLVNWCREIEKHSQLSVTKVHGNDEDALLHWRQNGDVAVTTYESISRFKLPEKFKISMVVTDEAHYVKNPETLRTKALVSLLQRTENILFMSGTPLENNVDELCFLVSCLQPELAQSLNETKYLSTAQQFREQLAPVYLRRTRDDVLQELPELTEKEQWCVLQGQEKQAYHDAVMSENFMAMRQVSWNAASLSQSSKAARLLELCDQAKEQNRKVIVFSFFRSTIQKVTQLLGDRCMEPITGDISPQHRQEIVDQFTAAPNGAVLVSQVQAGGTGLNIQSASVIIFCEPQIKPSIENQAISRAYRMGQVRDVLVYRLLADDTIDERIMVILQNKQELFDNFADESAVGTESLKPSEQSWISAMVAEEKARLENENN